MTALLYIYNTMLMKKLIALLSVLALTFLVSCGKEKAVETVETNTTEIVDVEFTSDEVNSDAVVAEGESVVVETEVATEAETMATEAEVTTEAEVMTTEAEVMTTEAEMN